MSASDTCRKNMYRIVQMDVLVLSMWTLLGWMAALLKVLNFVSVTHNFREIGKC